MRIRDRRSDVCASDLREQRRTQLVDAAIIAIDRLGHQAGIADIAAEAGVSKPVLYRYFADKSELHAAVGARMAEETMAQVIGPLMTAAPIRERVGAAVDGYLEAIPEHPQVFLLVFQHRPEGDAPSDEIGRAQGGARMCSQV